MSNEANTAKLLELAPAEIAIPLKVIHAGRTYRLCHLLRPPTAADWFAYEAALEMAVEELPPAGDSDEPCFRLQVRSSDAALELWNRLARRVEGYDLPAASLRQAGLPAETDADWRALIPLAHKEAAVNALSLVAPVQASAAAAPGISPNGHFPLLANETAIVLEAIVAGVAYPRLVHRFHPPSVDAERAYRRLLAETLIVRGSRTPRTLLPARLPGLVRLYDQLIVGIEGYSLNGQPLTDPHQVVRAMDAWHKRVAVQALFGELSVAAAGETPAGAEIETETLASTESTQ